MKPENQRDLIEILTYTHADYGVVEVIGLSRAATDEERDAMRDYVLAKFGDSLAPRYVRR